VEDAISDDYPRKTDKAPNPSQMVFVECDGLRYVVNQDQSGKWRTLSSRMELKGDVQVIKVLR
jgi:hypothetical protein